MCRKHLLGEHLECHMFAGHLAKGRGIQGYLDNNLLEPSSVSDRHDVLAKEIGKRGFKHKSPLKKVSLSSYSDSQVNHAIDKEKAESDLRDRCKVCRLLGKDKWNGRPVQKT